MARKIKPPDDLPSKAWLMSFGDTMTTLLAFFIVLVSLAENQTGANLHSGTGSFMRTLKTGGAPGLFSGDTSKRAVQLEATSPLYRSNEDTEEDGDGPDEDNDVPSKDREQEAFSRFLNEMERKASLETGYDTTGETTFDFFVKFSEDPPYLPGNIPQIAVRVLPVLKRPSYRVELIVWAPTPSQTAIARSAIRASKLRDEILKRSRLPIDASRRLLGVTRTWPYAKMKRPIMSVVIRRVQTE